MTSLRAAEWVAADLIAFAAAVLVILRARQGYKRYQQETSQDDQGRPKTTEYSSQQDD